MNTRTVTIGRHRIGDGGPCLIIAEAGVNHNGDIKTALELVDVAVEAGADIVGTNCVLAIEHLLEIVVAMRGATDLPILAHVNAGIPKIMGKEIVYPDSPDHMAQQMPQLVEAGANIVGGCCGTGPAHVKAFVDSLK